MQPKPRFLSWIMLGIFLVNTSFMAGDAIRTDWDALQNIQFSEKYIAEVKGYMLFPKFPASILAMNGKQVHIEGYVIPFDKTGEKVALSANPYAACYFCGKAGPASVMTVALAAKNTRYRTDQYRAFEGKLRLNGTDIKEFYYVLEGAVEVKRN